MSAIANLTLVKREEDSDLPVEVPELKDKLLELETAPDMPPTLT